MNKAINFPKLSLKTIKTIKKMATDIEFEDLRVAKDLMLLAHLAKPESPFIKRKLDEYNKRPNPSPSDLKLKDMLASGEIAIIPIGFRCHTKIRLKKSLWLSQPSFPFDVGFFPPISVASIIKNPKINLNFNESNSSHTPCIKHERYNDPVYGKGIKFSKSTYEEINSYAISRDVNNLNHYLDTSYGYYTLDLNHNFVLAHYNWHRFASPKHSNGIYDIQTNIDNINKTLNRRINRMFNVCNFAKYTFFVFLKNPTYNYMMIDDQRFDLNDLEVLKDPIKKAFACKSFIVNFKDVNSSRKILKIIK